MPTSVQIFDVYLIGAKDKNPSTQMRLVGSIAARWRLSAPVVAEALEGVPCRVAEKLGRREADALVESLGALGALTRLTLAGTPLAATSLPAAAGRTRELPPDGLFSPPTRNDGRITLKSADLDTGAVVDVSEPIEFAEPGPDAKTGVRGSDTVRCPIHGLVYNRRKASGCVRCLAPARARARKLQEESRVVGSGDGMGLTSLRDNPVRRAFWGLGIALLVGLVPAVIYAKATNRREIDALRTRQAEISTLPSTKESLARFDELDAAVDSAHRRGAGRTLLIWIAVGGITALVWTRLTRPTGIPLEP
ncbi:MAG: hypothetical protein H7X95_01580 [Deltaproteobacteria bacterium]|nr:hypothetical protein [Deltaproteobacteria bacterium]